MAGPPASHVKWVDGTGTEIPRFAMITLPGAPVPSNSGIVFDTNNLAWIVQIDSVTQTASAVAMNVPTFITSYTGADCTGDIVIAYTGQPRNAPFTMGTDTTIRIFPTTAPTSIAVASTNFVGGCTNAASNVTGYLAPATVPATALTPPVLTWSGPIEARWVD